MARVINPISRFSGISYSEKEGPRSSFLFAKSIDFRTDPSKIKLNPRTLKVSGTVVTDLILDGDRQGTDTYLYGDTGNIYKMDSSESFSLLSVVANSQGNGMRYYGEDQFLYYASDITIGRYGPFGGTQTFNDDFLGSEGGTPTNTHSLTLDGTADYATAADSASLSITGDLTLESYVKFNSLPDTGESMVFISKWNEASNQRSYRFEIAGVNAYFGDGGDGALTISSNTTQSPTDSAATGTSGAYTLSATNASFAADDKILIHQTQGTNAGVWERNEILSYTAGTITLKNALANTYTSGAQVIVIPEYTDVTVNSGITWTAKDWNGTVGGILVFLANGDVTITGTIAANGEDATSSAFGDEVGFSGIGNAGIGQNGKQGEGSAASGGTRSTSANGNGGGGGKTGSHGGGGGGGGNGTVGSNGGSGSNGGGSGGNISGSADLTTMTFGGGGGGGGGASSANVGAVSGAGAGIVFISGSTVTVTGSITANGGDGWGGSGQEGKGGGGAGGSILIKTQTATLGSSLIAASGGTGGTSPATGGNGGNGGVGRIHVDYLTSVSGTTSPTLDSTQDNTLTSSGGHQLRLGISSNGTNEEFLATEIETPQTDTWYRFSVTWDASASTAVFYQNAMSVGTQTGSLTAIDDSTALLAIGASFDGSGSAENFLDALVDDNRIFDDIRTANEILLTRDIELASATANLQAYYQHDNALTDSSANSNTLTLVSAPPYSTDVPFSAPTSRRDLDQSLDTSGNTYTLATAINEGATHIQSFVPEKDPQKSIEVLIAAVGTGNWTITVHDSLNREVASLTVSNGDLNAGDYEFVFSSPWRPVLGATYHFHLTSTVADGTVTTTTASSLETVDFHTYYQFLVEDANHPIHPVVNKLAIGNERYLATWDGVTYNPHALTFPSGYRVRSLALWRGYLMIGCTRGTSLTDYDQGIIFIWDGIHSTYNDYIPVKEGGVNAMVSGDPLYIMAGYTGDLLEYRGGSLRKLRRLPKITDADSLEVNRNAMAMWKSLVRIGLAENSTSTDIERGVYSWGSLHAELPETLSFDYPLSLGITQSANIDIGMTMAVGSNLLISWRNQSSYGVDIVTPTNDPYPTGRIEFLIQDSNKIWAEKQASVLRGYFKALASGDTMQFEYKIDRNDNWTEGDTESTTGAKETRLNFPTKGNRFNELQIALEMGTSNSTSPEFYGFGSEEDDLNRERRT